MREYAVIGLGQFGGRVARTVTELGGIVIGVDRDMHIVEEIKDDIAQAICLDATNEAAMRAAGIADVDAAVVALGGASEASILTTAVLHQLGIGEIIARANSPLHERILKLVGARRVYNPEEQMAVQVGRSVISPDVHEVIPLSSGHSLVEVEALPSFTGHTIRQLEFRPRFSLNIIALKKKRPVVKDDGTTEVLYELNDLPHPDDVIDEGDILLVVGSDEKIRELEAQR
jgi:trk system potassium uptake protein TrkA